MGALCNDPTFSVNIYRLSYLRRVKNQETRFISSLSGYSCPSSDTHKRA